MKRVIFIGIFLVLVSLSVSPLNAEEPAAGSSNQCLNEAHILYKGLDCPTCAYLVKKKMSELEGVVSSKMLFTKHEFFLTGTQIDFNKARQLIKDATLTPGPIQVSLCGLPKLSEGGKEVLQDSSEDQFRLMGISADQWADMTKHPKVKVTGTLSETDQRVVNVTGWSPQ